MDHTITELAAWSARCSDRHSATATARARDAVLDTVGCIVAGSGDRAMEIRATAVSGWGAGRCTVVGRADGLAAPWAAMVNATAAHALDFDDYDPTAIAHVSAVLVPALIALVEERGKSVRELLDAYIVGFEVLARVGEAINPAHYRRGWHATSTIGALAAAVARGRLLRLDAGRMASALSLGTSMASGSRVQIGTNAKPMHAGFAAKAGILAVRLAELGATAAVDALDGPRGFEDLLAGARTDGFHRLRGKLGAPPAQDEFGLIVKRFPSCDSTLRSIDGVPALRAEHGISPGDDACINTVVPEMNARNLIYPAPESYMQARFSIQYCLAVALIQGDLTIADFTAEAVRLPEIRAWLPMITMHAHPPDSQNSDADRLQPATMTLVLKSGEQLTISIAFAKGSMELPLSADELLAKFRSCTGGRLPAGSVQSLEDSLLHLDAVPQVREVSSLLAGAFPARAAALICGDRA